MADKRIKAPLPGTFYRRPEPDADPFVTEGQEVDVGDIIGLVEVMKSFYEVRTAESGVIDDFFVESEEIVESDQDIASLRDR